MIYIAMFTIVMSSFTAFAADDLADILRKNDITYKETRICDMTTDGTDTNCKDFNSAENANSVCENLNKNARELNKLVEDKFAEAKALHVKGLKPFKPTPLMKCDMADTGTRLKLAKGYIFEDEGRGRGLIFPLGKEEDISKNPLMKKFYVIKGKTYKRGQVLSSAIISGETLVLKVRDIDEYDEPSARTELDNSRLIVATFETTTISFTAGKCEFRKTRYRETKSYSYTGAAKSELSKGFSWTGTCGSETPSE
jgi:hypothetical protein